MDINYFESQAEFRAWLMKNHATASAIQVGYYKVASGHPGITYKQSVDEALCFGWIDGVRNSVDKDSYTNRFTPRKPKSIWSAVNIKRVKELIELGLMQPSGLKKFESRDPERANLYSSEQKEVKLTDEQEEQFRANAPAWANFEKMPPSYKRPALWWIVSAKQDETREKRLKVLIENSERGLRVPPLRRKGDKSE